MATNSHPADHGLPSNPLGLPHERDRSADRSRSVNWLHHMAQIVILARKYCKPRTSRDGASPQTHEVVFKAHTVTTGHTGLVCRHRGTAGRSSHPRCSLPSHWACSAMRRSNVSNTGRAERELSRDGERGAVVSIFAIF